MEMSDELRELFKSSYEEAAKTCCSCNHKCFLYLLITYIDENGFEYFQYQQQSDSLPIEINIAYENFLNVYVPLLKPGVINVITPPWC